MTLTVTEFARMGGKARAEKLPKSRREEIARKANEARWAGHIAIKPKRPAPSK